MCTGVSCDYPSVRVLLDLLYVYVYVGGSGELSQYRDWLRAGQSGDRIPVGARFSALVQTGPWFHPASYTIGTCSFLGVKRLGRGIDHPPHLVPRLTFMHRASRILGQAFRYSPENAFYIFNQQIYFII